MDPTQPPQRYVSTVPFAREIAVGSTEPSPAPTGPYSTMEAARGSRVVQVTPILEASLPARDR